MFDLPWFLSMVTFHTSISWVTSLIVKKENTESDEKEWNETERIKIESTLIMILIWTRFTFILKSIHVLILLVSWVMQQQGQDYSVPRKRAGNKWGKVISPYPRTGNDFFFLFVSKRNEDWMREQSIGLKVISYSSGSDEGGNIIAFQLLF